MNFPSDIDAPGRFGTGLSQHARLLTLASAQDGSLPESLVVERFRGREAVDALSVSTDLDLSAFTGTELTVGLLQPDGSRRARHGLCTAAAFETAYGATIWQWDTTQE
jgi:type VI secretion system secreted protein VgrG